MGKITNSVNHGKQNVVDVWQKTTQKQDVTPSSKARSKEHWQSSTKQLIASFNDSTTVHGVRFAFGADISVKRRMIWISLCVLSTCLLAVNVAERIQHYMSYPVSVNLQVNYRDSMEFPAVTICNQNSFRRTLSMENGHYELLKALYGNKGDSSGWRELLLDTWSNVTMETLFINNSHRAEDLIVTCKWKGETCTWTDFRPVLTQHGQCFTFLGNTSIEDGQIVDSPGVDNGLELVLNVEDYDSMVGPHSSSGVKVVLHHATEVPMPEYGNELPTGRHGFMDVQVSKAQNVPPPHGKCVTRPLVYMDMYSYTVGACHMECEMEYVMSMCHCRQIHVPRGMYSLPSCNVDQYSQCLVEAKVNYRRRRDVTCSCPIPCTQTWYQPDLSYGTISRFSTSQKRILQKRKLRKQFHHSREMAFPEEMDYSILYELHSHLGQISLPSFYRVLNDLESVDKVLSQSSSAIKGFYNDIQRARIYLEKSHKVYGRFQAYSKLLDGTHLGLDFMELTSFIDSQILLMESTDMTDKRKAYYEMIYAKAKLDLTAIKKVVKDTEFLSWLSNQYPDIWFVDDGDLQSIAKPVVYTIPPDLQWMGISETMTKCINNIERYIHLANAFLKDGVIDLKQWKLLNSTSLSYAQTFEKQRNNMETFYKESVVSNLEHLSYVLGLRSQPMTSVISTFDKKCTTMYITKGIRKASMYLNRSVDSLSQYYNKRQILQTVVSHFDTNEMKYFMEEVRTFASGTFHNNELSMESADCLDMLLDEYYAMLTVYKTITPALTQYQTPTGYTAQPNTMPSQAQLQNYKFDKAELLEVILVLDNVIKMMEEFKQSLKMNQQFYRDNFLHLNVLFHELRYEQLTQQIDYTFFALMGDVGGAMGLCIGASALSVFEIIDFVSMLVGSIMHKRRRSSNPRPKVVHVKPKREAQVITTLCDSDGIKQKQLP